MFINVSLEVEFRCQGCGGIMEPEIEAYYPTIDSLPSIPRNYLKVPVCITCVDLRIRRISQLLQEGVDENTQGGD